MCSKLEHRDLRSLSFFAAISSVSIGVYPWLKCGRDAARLAGKAGAKDVVRRDVRHRHGMNVAVRGFAEIGGVGLLRVFVPVGGEHALAPGALKREPEAADAAEKVNERRTGVAPVSNHFGSRKFTAGNGDRRDALSYAIRRHVFAQFAGRARHSVRAGFWADTDGAQ